MSIYVEDPRDIASQKTSVSSGIALKTQLCGPISPEPWDLGGSKFAFDDFSRSAASMSNQNQIRDGHEFGLVDFTWNVPIILFTELLLIQFATFFVIEKEWTIKL